MTMITTTHGLMEESGLRKVEGLIDNDHERTTWVEYYLENELVHRSVHVSLKEWPGELAAVLKDLTE